MACKGSSVRVRYLPPNMDNDMGAKKKNETRVCVRCKKRFPIEKMHRLHGSLLCKEHYEESSKGIDDIFKNFAAFCKDAGKKE